MTTTTERVVVYGDGDLGAGAPAEDERVTVFGGGYLDSYVDLLVDVDGGPLDDEPPADFAAEPEEGEGHWVTINGNPIFLGGDGTILKGAARLVGKKVGELRAEGRVKEGSPQAKASLGEVPHTRGSPDGDGSLGNPIAVGDDIERAAKLIAEGKHVRLNQPNQVSTLLDKLAANVSDARAKGEKAPNYDLGKVTIPGTNLFTQESKGIPRVQMPQLKGEAVAGSAASKLSAPNGEADISDALLRELKDRGIRTSGAFVPAANLRATQIDLDGGKVAGMVRSMKSGSMKEEAIFVSRDNYVIDGHHRWAAKIGIDLADNKLGNVRQSVIRVDSDIGEIIDMTREFAKQMGIKQKAAFNLGVMFLRALQALNRQVTIDAGGTLGDAAFADDNDDGGDEDGRWVTIGGHAVFIKSSGAPETGAKRTLGARDAAQALRKKARGLEPTVSKVLQAAAARSGAELDRFDTRFKTPDSIARKVENFAKELKIPEKEVLEQNRVHDYLRYTVVEPSTRDYISTVQGISDDLHEQGINLNIENFWVQGDAYNGINANGSDAQGRTFEVQFHTRDSLRIAEENHPDYEYVRDKTHPTAERRARFERMRDRTDAQPFPANPLSIGTPTVKEFKPA